MDLLVLLLPAAAVVVPALLFFLRPEFRRASKPMLAGPLWTGAWAALFASGLSFGIAGQHVVLDVLGTIADALFPVLLLAGALAFTERQPWKSIWVLGVGLVAFHVATMVALERSTALAVQSVVKSPIEATAAWLLWRGTPRARGSFAARVLAGMFFAIAVNEVADIAVRVHFGEHGMLLGWLSLSFGTIFVSVLLFAERSRARQERLRQHRDLLQRISAPLLDGKGAREALARIASEIDRTGLFPLVGLWLRGPDGRRFESVAGFEPAQLPEPLRSPDPERPLMRAVLAASEPLYLNPSREEESVSPELRALAPSNLFVAPLRSEGETIGFLAGTTASEADTDDRALIADLAVAVAHVVANAVLHETLAQRTADLAAERSLLLATVESVPVGLLLADREGFVRLINRSLAAQLGIADPASWSGRRSKDPLAWLRKHVEPGAVEAVDRELARDAADRCFAIPPFEVRIAWPEPRILEVSSVPVAAPDGGWLGRVWLVRDVTDERELAERMQHAQRMETVGTLAGGLAHDFNNQLTAILGNARLLLDELPPDDPSCPPLRDLERSAEHCAELTQELLEFAKQAPSSPSAVSSTAAIAQVEALLRPAIGPGIAFRVRVEPRTPPLAADAFQLRRVLVNLVVNARDAVAGSGSIELWARRAPQTADAPGAFVEIGVRDDGAGMDEQTRRRIFDPFFTTKDSGTGTGLGLAIAYGIVTAHGGTIRVESKPGEGTTFFLLWPAASEAELSESPEKIPSIEKPRTGAILVAEDEPSVRRLVCTALERGGHRVIEVSDGGEAVAYHARHVGEIDLAVLDLSMPQRNGLEALAAMRAVDPGLPAIVMSGHPDRAGPSAWPENLRVLRKPFGPRELLQLVERSLGEAALARRAP